MPTLYFECEVDAPIEVVWAWHEDLDRALPALSPPEDNVALEKLGWTGKPHQGAQLLIRAKGPLGLPVRWLAEYVEYSPPAPVLHGVEARFVDIQLRGPFHKWRHSHEFEAVTSARTRCVDHIDYLPPLYPLSWPADRLFIRPKLVRMFQYRHDVLRRTFGPEPARSTS